LASRGHDAGFDSHHGAGMSANEPLGRGASLKDGIAASRAGDRKAVFLIALQQVGFGVLPIVLTVWLLATVLGGHNRILILAVDFRDAYWTAAHRLLYGGNPYAWTGAQIRDGVAFVYPALSAVVFVPFAIFTRWTAGVLFTLVCIALAPATLWMLKVRDWRVYGVALMWLPVCAAWQTGNESIVLVFITALIWRYRDRRVTVAILVAVAISLKPFMWPLELWLLATRRWRASVYTLVFGLVLNVIVWALVGFGQIRTYMHLVSLDAHDSWRAGYGTAAAFAHLGVGRAGGDVMTVLISSGLAAAVVHAGFIKRRERRALILMIALMLVASPLVWDHYFALLLVPMALERPRLGWLWALPVLMWACGAAFHVHAWQEALAWLIAGTMLVSVSKTARA
jgi:hypothetical protein